MKTKIITIFLALVAGVGTMFADKVKIGNLYYNLNDEGKTAEVTSQNQWSTNNYKGLTIANIPAFVEYNAVTYSVTSIGNGAFNSCSSLTSVTIENGVTSIGENAFSGCENLNYIEISNSVTSIGERAFVSCKSLTFVIIPNSVTSIGREAFDSCSGLTSVIMGNGVKSIEEMAFSGCTSLTSIEIPNSVISIGNYAFSGCNGLTSVNIGNGVTSIGDWAFAECPNLTSVNIPNSVTSIGKWAFYGCSSLTNIEIPNSVKSIGGSVFKGCTSLTSPIYNTHVFAFMPTTYSGAYTIPDGIELIVGFDGCTDLTSVKIPNSVTSIGERTFYGCSGLTSIEIPNSIKSIGKNAFDECSGLTSVHISDIAAWCDIVFSPYDRYTTIGNYHSNPLAYAHKLFLNGELVTDLVFPNGVTTISDAAFCGCSSLTSVTIPNNVTSIERSAFESCSSLTSVIIGNGVTSIGDYAFSYCRNLTSVKIGNSVTSIGLYAFKECTTLPSITIPNSVTDIGMAAFSDCTSLVSVTLPNSINSINVSVFDDCTSLSSITIPSSVTSIGQYAFAFCSGLTSITCLATTPPVIDAVIGYPTWSAFYNVDCSKISLYVPVKSVSAYKAADYWKVFNPISPISANRIVTDTIKAEPTETSVEVTWPGVSGASTYELVIKDKYGNLFCTLIFNAHGQLLSIVFNAPARGKTSQQTQVAGFTYTVTGLEEGTDYDLTITAKDENGNDLDKKEISFHTNGANGIEDIVVDEQKANKILLDGQIYILRADHIFDTQGKMVR